MEIKDDSYLPVRMVEKGGDQWTMPDFGLVGLAPNGDFANYLRKNYPGDVNMLFSYKTFKK